MTAFRKIEPTLFLECLWYFFVVIFRKIKIIESRTRYHISLPGLLSILWHGLFCWITLVFHDVDIVEEFRPAISCNVSQSVHFEIRSGSGFKLLITTLLKSIMYFLLLLQIKRHLVLICIITYAEVRLPG